MEIVCLPDAYLLLFLSDWLTLTDVANFDSSFCCGERIWLLELFHGFKQKHNSNDCTKTEICEHNFYRWILLRGIQLKYLEFTQKSFAEKCDKTKELLTFPIKLNNIAGITLNCLNDSRQRNIHAPPSVASLKSIEDDTEIIRIINILPQLRILKFTSSHNYFADTSFDKINSCIVAQLTELTFADNRNINYPNTVAIIGKLCRSLRKLNLDIHTSEADITAIVANNPHLVDISVSLGGGYRGLPVESVVSFLEFLITTRRTIKSLNLHDNLADGNYMPIIARFLCRFQNTLEKLRLSEIINLSQLVSSDKLVPEKSMAIHSLCFCGTGHKSDDAFAMMKSVQNVTSFALDGPSDNVVLAELVKMLVQCYSESLRKFTMMIKDSSDVGPLHALIKGCTNLKTIHLTALMAQEFAPFETLRTLYPHVEIKFKALLGEEILLQIQNY